MARIISGYSELKYRSEVVIVGALALGGSHPVRVQSMTNIPIANINDTVHQCLRLWEAGAELIRIATPGRKDAGLLPVLKKSLHAAGCQLPLCADIHFLPEAAMEAALHVEKIRVNPGNYVDRPWHSTMTGLGHDAIMDQARQYLEPLIKACHDHGTVIRIGVNHGSLSDRIKQTHGNTPEGMVASAMEFIRLCEALHFFNLVVSMKASSVGTTIRATRLLASTLAAHGRCYPIHLGVTEAGEGQDGRMKSFVGIGTLLGEGLGDTIRVSLTEDPEKEIPVARQLVDFYAITRSDPGQGEKPALDNPFQYQRRKTIGLAHIGGNHPPIVIQSGSARTHVSSPFPDYLVQTTGEEMLLSPGPQEGLSIPILSPPCLTEQEPDTPRALLLNKVHDLETLPGSPGNKTIIIKNIPPQESIRDQYRFLYALDQAGLMNPVIFALDLHTRHHLNPLLSTCTTLGPLLMDGLADGLWLRGDLPHEELADMAFSLLQVCERRQTKTRYISCPSCGRTQFDIQSLLQEIKAATAQLSHLCIGVMGCVVNGPGEMEGADYGCVGAGKGLVHLYKGVSLVKRNIPQDQATAVLIELIKEHGDWIQA